MTKLKQDTTLRLPAWPHCDTVEEEALLRVLRSGQWWRGGGTEVESFEKEFAAFHNARHALAVSSGTQAIELALRALDLKPGDEVVVPSFTFISTASPVPALGAHLVFADVDERTYCLHPSSFREAISSRTRAVIPVHMAGHCCDMRAISSIAREHDIEVLEDCAHAHGAECAGRRVGSMGFCGIFSFQNYKLMTAGEGGALVTNRPRLHESLTLLHNCGRPFHDREYLHMTLGSNTRMTEFQAALLRVQLKRLEAQNRRREVSAALLDHLLADVEGIQPQGRLPYCTLHSHYMYMFRYRPRAFGRVSRDEFVARLNQLGLPAFRGYRALHKMPAFQGTDVHVRKTDLTVSEHLDDSTVWLHHRTLLADEETMKAVAQVIREAALES